MNYINCENTNFSIGNYYCYSITNLLLIFFKYFRMILGLSIVHSPKETSLVFKQGR